MLRSVSLAALIALGAANQVAAQPSGSLNGYLFGDFYWVAQSHRGELDGENGFWFRRIYFTYDQPLDDEFTTRFRLEMNSAGDFTSSTKITAFVKDAYLRWSLGRQRLIFGLSPTPTWDVVESVWGYRSVEKTPLDLQRFGGSRDLGVAFQGSVGKESRTNYHVMVGNGSDTAAETDRNKAFYASLGHRFSKALFVEIYGDWLDKPNGTSWTTWQVFGAYQGERGRVGLQFAQQARRHAIRGADRLELASAFAVANLAEKVTGFARVDRMFDANPEGERIPYVPFSNEARSLFSVVGIDIAPTKKVHFMPNVEVIRYGDGDQLRPRTDVIPRLTLFFVWP